MYLISIQYTQWQTTGLHDSFGSPEWDLQRMWASERAMMMYNQGFIHPATLAPEELSYNKGYKVNVNKLNEKFKDIYETSCIIESLGLYSPFLCIHLMLC